MGQMILLKRQHNEILELTEKIQRAIKNKECNTEEIVKQINVLSGKLKVHLSIEDKHLYPELLNSSNYKLKQMAKQYMDEMGDFVEEYNLFKNKFNTQTKLQQNYSEFENHSSLIFSVLKSRISKEDNELYLLTNV